MRDYFFCFISGEKDATQKLTSEEVNAYEINRTMYKSLMAVL